jgi:5,6-dimethylbenzimidazole synthase
MSDFSASEQQAFYRLIQARRDIRQFRPEPVAPAVLARILHAAHQAPSVGFMQPWNFILVTSLEVRQRIQASFQEQRQREQEQIADPARQALYRQLKLEGILEAPLNLAVTCDHDRGAPFVLGRAAMPETDLYSTCLAIQNLWLAARVEGIGVGWVSILERHAVESILGLPPTVQLVAYLCLGYPVEFRPLPMLEEVGWKDRLPFADLVFQDSWGIPACLGERPE